MKHQAPSASFLFATLVTLKLISLSLFVIFCACVEGHSNSISLLNPLIV